MMTSKDEKFGAAWNTVEKKPKVKGGNSRRDDKRDPQEQLKEWSRTAFMRVA
jgi:hypothetical protein